MRKTAEVLAGQALVFLLQMGATLFAVRYLGSKGQGEFSVTRTAVYLGEAFLWVGLNSGFVYLVASNVSKYMRTIFYGSVLHLAAALMAITIVVEVASKFLKAGSVLEAILDRRTLFLIWLGTYALVQLVQRSLVSAQEFQKGNRMGIFNAALIFPLLLVWFVFAPITVNAVIGVNVAANVAAICYGSVLLYSAIQLRDELSATSWAYLPIAYRVGFKGFVSTVAFMALYRIDFLLIGHYMGIKTAGVYAVATFIIESVQKLSDWLGTILTPKVAAGEDDTGHTTYRYLAVGVSVVAIFGLILALVTFSGGHFLQLAFGKDFVGLDRLVLLLVPRGVLHAAMVVHAAFLSGKGYTLYHPAAGIAAALFLIAWDCWMIPRMGIAGAVLGITGAYLLATAIMVLGFRRNRTPILVTS